MKNCTQIIIALCICVFYPAIATPVLNNKCLTSLGSCDCGSTNTGFCCPDTTVTCNKCPDGYKAATFSVSLEPASCRRETEYIASDSEHRYTVKTYNTCDTEQVHPLKHVSNDTCGQGIWCLKNNGGTIQPSLPPLTPVEL